MHGRLKLWAVLWLIVASSAVAGDAVTTYTLANGLTVMIRPVAGTNRAALMVLYDIGSDHDPSQQSGLAHVIEHLYVTAAAGDTPARTADQYIKFYPLGWNAQTLPDATIFSTVFPADHLERELTDAAARMGALKITQADVDREKPRVATELDNMYVRLPELVAANMARERARPVGSDGRRGGNDLMVTAMKLEVLADRWLKYYKPANATLVIVGGVDLAHTRAIVDEKFRRIPSGKRIKPVTSFPLPRLGKVDTVVARPAPGAEGECIGVAVKAPLPDDPRYPAFLVAVGRMWANTQVNPAARGTHPVARFTPLDDPTVLTITAPLATGETVQQGIQRIDAFIQESTTPALTPADSTHAQLVFGSLLGFLEIPDHVRAQNLYGMALAIGRGHQLKLDADKLGPAIGKVAPDAYRRAVDTLLSPEKRATVAVVLEGG